MKLNNIIQQQKTDGQLPINQPLIYHLIEWAQSQLRDRSQEAAYRKMKAYVV